MHVCSQQIYTLAHVARISHDAPFFEPNLVHTACVAVLGGMLWVVSQSSDTILQEYDTASFYMAHVWAVIINEIVVRRGVNSAITFVVLQYL